MFTGKYPDPEPQYIYTDDDFGNKFTTIAELKQMYNGKPVKISKSCVIKGQVTTSDQVGNLYKSLYIQDETAGIEVKIGKNGLYNEYKLGQWIYVDCTDLTIGDYNGMINLGYDDPTNKYETSYMEHAYIIDSHVFKGEYDEPVKPVVVKEADLLKDVNMGRLVTIENLKYSYYGYDQDTKTNKTIYIFILAYVDPNGDRKDYTNNGIFIDESWNQPADKDLWVDTWACSETKWKEYLYSGIFDDVEVANTTVGAYYEHFMSVINTEYKSNQDLQEYLNELPDVYKNAINSGKIEWTLYQEILSNYPDFSKKFGNFLEEKETGYKEVDDEGNVYYHIGSMAYSVSQYFTMGSTGVQVRSSGYARFADTKIPAEILDGTATVSFTGILTQYKGKAQFTLIDLNGVKKADGTNWY